MRKAWLYLLAAVICVLAVFPFYWAVVTSFKTGSELFRMDWLPPRLTSVNYAAIFLEQPFGRNLLNSVIVAGSTVVLASALAVLAAYPLSRQSFRGRRFVLLSFLFVSMFPQIAILSGLFELMRAIGAFNHVSALILSYLIFTLPFTVWTLSAFMRELPRGLEEAALVDGAGRLTLIFRILLPTMAPALVTTSLLAFIAAWNEFLFALTFTMTERARTVPVAIATMSGASEHEIPWGRIMAASVLVTVPVIGMVLVLQRRIVAGLTAGAVKG